MDQHHIVSRVSPASGIGAVPLSDSFSLPSAECSPGLAALFHEWERAWTIEIAASSAADRARIAVAGGKGSPTADLVLLLRAEEEAAAALARIDRVIAAYPATILGDLLAKLRFLDRLEPFTERAREGDWDAQMLAGILADAERLHRG